MTGETEPPLTKHIFPEQADVQIALTEENVFMSTANFQAALRALNQILLCISFGSVHFSQKVLMHRVTPFS